MNKLVMIETNATNRGDPEKRVLVADNGWEATDILNWLATNGIRAKIVSVDEYYRKLRNYRERVAAAS